jgi:hypothetical protein
MRGKRDGLSGPFATAARGRAAPGKVTKKSHPRRQRREKDHPSARVRQRRTCVALAPGDTLRSRCRGGGCWLLVAGRCLPCDSAGLRAPGAIPPAPASTNHALRGRHGPGSALPWTPVPSGCSWKTGLGSIRRCWSRAAAARRACPATSSATTPGPTASRCLAATCTRA